MKPPKITSLTSDATIWRTQYTRRDECRHPSDLCGDGTLFLFVMILFDIRLVTGTFL